MVALPSLRWLPTRTQVHLARALTGLPVILVLAVAARFPFLPATGNLDDIAGLVQFGTQVATAGPQTLYDPPDIHQTYYVLPPIFPFLLGFSYWLWAHAAHLITGLGPDGLLAPPFSLAATFVKLWGIAADLALGVVIYTWVERRYGRRWAAATAAAFLFQPGVIYDSAFWGQIDSLVALCIASAILSLSDVRSTHSWLWLAAGMLVKPQAVLALPIVGVTTLLNRGPWAVARGMA
ncbi:MAG TPA: hypothetical protein VGW38_27670, partial [Chloroflexota bacterium]|nr:hypothetical protein [Chloroflexota bacterium]